MTNINTELLKADDTDEASGRAEADKLVIAGTNDMIQKDKTNPTAAGIPETEHVFLSKFFSCRQISDGFIGLCRFCIIKRREENI